jgi:hypothetical protein
MSEDRKESFNEWFDAVSDGLQKLPYETEEEHVKRVAFRAYHEGVITQIEKQAD